MAFVKSVNGGYKPNKETIIAAAAIDFAGFLRQRAHVERLDHWMRGSQFQIKDTLPNTSQAIGMPWSPSDRITEEYTDLAHRSPAPWGKLITNAVVQTVYVDNVRIKFADDTVREGTNPDQPTLPNLSELTPAGTPGISDNPADGSGNGGSEPGDIPNMEAWDILLSNDWDSRQISLVRNAVGHGLAYVRALPGKDPLTNESSAVVRPVSAMRMAAFFDDFDDEWPTSAIEGVIEGTEIEPKWRVLYYDDDAVHTLELDGDGSSTDPKDWKYVAFEYHGLGVVPVVQWANQLDLDGNALGEIEPIIPLLRRIDQDTFDRLIVQRFGAWKVRYIAGLMRPGGGSAEEHRKKIELAMEDILIAPDKDTKFGTLDATPTTGYIEATDADLRVLAAVTQTPPHHLLGLSSNLQAEALAAAEAGLQRKSQEFKIFNAGAQVRLLRLVAKIVGNTREATAKNIEVRYRDTESRSLVQAAQALSQLASGLGIPVEMLWDRVPNWTDDDTERAKQLIEQGTIDALLAAVAGAGQQQGGDANDAANAQGKDGSTLNAQQSAAKATGTPGS